MRFRMKPVFCIVVDRFSAELKSLDSARKDGSLPIDMKRHLFPLGALSRHIQVQT